MKRIIQDTESVKVWMELQSIVLETFDLNIIRTKLADPAPQTAEESNTVYRRILQFLNKLYLAKDLYSMQTVTVISSIAESMKDDDVRRFFLEFEKLFLIEWMGRGYTKEDFIDLVVRSYETPVRELKDLPTHDSLLGTSVVNRLAIPENFLSDIIRNDLWYGLMILLKLWWPKTTLFQSALVKESEASGPKKS